MEPSPAKAQPAPGDASRDLFLELFAGAGGLTAAVGRSGMRTAVPEDIVQQDGSLAPHFDLLQMGHLQRVKKLCRTRVRWLHGGLPCKTFTMARRADQFGSARILRSDRQVMGIPPVPQRVRDASALAQRMVQLARIVIKAGG